MTEHRRAALPYRVALRRHLVAEGWTDASIRAAVGSGVLVRLRWGGYVFACGDTVAERDLHRLRAHAVWEASRADTVLSHTSALAELDVGLWDLPWDDVHVTRRDGRSGRRLSGVVRHRGLLDDSEIEKTRGGAVMTTPARAAIDTARLVDVEHAMVMFDALLGARIVTRDDLQAAYSRSEVWRDSRHIRIALMLAAVGAGSVGESRLRFLCFRFGLPKPELQYEVRDSSGHLIGYVDLAWPELGVLIEFDGKEKYSKYARPGESPADVVFREKVREDRLRELGYVVVRVTWADLRRPDAVAQRLRRAIAVAARTRR